MVHRTCAYYPCTSLYPPTMCGFRAACLLFLPMIHWMGSCRTAAPSPALPPSFNEPPEAPLTDPTRRGFEQLLRKLARLPRAPAVVVLHHYAWYFAVADGLQAGQYYRAPEQHLSTLAQVGGVVGQPLRGACPSCLQGRAGKLFANTPAACLRLPCRSTTTCPRPRCATLCTGRCRRMCRPSRQGTNVGPVAVLQCVVQTSCTVGHLHSIQRISCKPWRHVR